VGRGKAAYVRERCIQGCGYDTRRKRENLEEIGVDGRIMLKCVFKIVDWIDLA
jgi:hypothetical protein